MVDATIQTELSNCLEKLPVDRQRQVLEFALTLETSAIHGVRGADLLRFAGVIDKSDLDAMSRAIEDGCEGIDLNEW
ncbi:hypothetical protein SH449x_005249 [Pirellulaceae bacterium SH449]